MPDDLSPDDLVILARLETALCLGLALAAVSFDDQPSDDELAALAAVVAARFPLGSANHAPSDVGAAVDQVVGAADGGGVVIPLAGRRHTLAVNRWRALPAAAAVGLVAITGTAGMAAAGGTLPRSIRQVAYAVGLPVDSPDVADVRTAMHHLRQATAAEDPAAIDKAVAEVRAQLADLPAKERKRIVPMVNQGLASVGARPEPIAPPPPPEAVPPASPIPPAGTVPEPSPPTVTTPTATSPPVVDPPPSGDTTPPTEPEPTTVVTDPPTTEGPPPTEPETTTTTEPETTTTTTEAPASTPTTTDSGAAPTADGGAAPGGDVGDPAPPPTTTTTTGGEAPGDPPPAP